MAVLGAMILEGDTVRDIATGLRAEDFYLSKHRLIFQALVNLYQAGTPADLVTLTKYFQDNGQIGVAGGPAYLTGLINYLPTVVNYPHYVRIVKADALKREIIQGAAEIQGAARGPEEVGKLRDKLRALAEELDLSGVEKPEPVNVDAILEDIKRATAGLSTGYLSLDRFVEFNPCELIVLASRPRHGKTTLALNLCVNMLEKYPERPFIFFSYEMNREQILVKLVGAMTGESYKEIRNQIRDERLTKENLESLSKLSKHGEEKRLYLVNEPRWNVDRIASYCQGVKAEHKTVGAVFVDYIGLVALLEKAETVEQQYARVANVLRIASQELNCPVLAISQTSREQEKGKKEKDRYPRLDQMRYSGAIEQEATTVLALYNQEVDKRVDIEEAPAEDGYGEVDKAAQLWLFNLKSRYGPGNKPLPFVLKNGNKIEEIR